MTKEWIEERIKLAHENTIDKGFYDCPECGGYGENEHKVSKNIWIDCETCNDTRIDPNKNIGELLMLIVSELGEALEAHRCGRFADWENDDRWPYTMPDYENHNFKRFIKDTFEDEIADVFIRLFDLCGYLGLDLSETTDNITMKEAGNVGEDLYCAILKLPTLNVKIKDATFNWFFDFMISFCQHHNIPIQKHIEAKMAYNKTRPRKHGKEY